MENGILKEEAELLYREYYQYVFRTVLFLVKSKMLAEDITQETFLKIFEKYAMYDREKPLKPWIYKIAVNTVRNAVRRQKWLRFFCDVPEGLSCDLVESRALRKEEASEVWKAVEGLSRKKREVVILHFFAELRLSEIAYVLDIPLGTCKSRLNSALEALRKQVTGEGAYYILNEGGNNCGT